MTRDLDARQNSASRVQRARIPAWMMSVVVHLALFIVLAMTIQAVPKSLPDEPDRSASIVLARSDNNQQVNYLDEGDLVKEAKQQSEPSEPAPVTAANPPLLPEIALPGQVDLQIGDPSDLVVVPEFRKQSGPVILPGQAEAQILAEEAARQAAKGKKGPLTQVSLFGSAPAEGNSFVFVIDRSQSMGGDGLGALAAAEKELYTALSRLNKDHKFQILAYHHTTVYVGPRKMLDASEENKGRVNAYFAGLAAYGGTAHETALLSALRMKPDVVFFMTDGGDPYLNEAQLERIQARARGTTSIHCLQFGFGRLQEKENFMQRLARQNGGGFGYIDMSKR